MLQVHPPRLYRGVSLPSMAAVLSAVWRNRRRVWLMLEVSSPPGSPVGCVEYSTTHRHLSWAAESEMTTINFPPDDVLAKLYNGNARKIIYGLADRPPDP